jgi:DnaJ family protein C protein 2
LKKAEAEAKAKADEEVRLAAVAEAAKEAKKAKEAEASALRRERKALKTLFAENNYYVPTNLDSATKLKLLEEESMLVEQLCQRLDKLELAAVRETIQAAADFSAVTNVLRERLGLALKEIAKPAVENGVPVAAKIATAEAPAVLVPEWNLHDMDLLINGTKKFPGGTRNRWETIAEWFNRQALTQRSVDELLNKANELKASATQATGLGGLAGVDTTESIIPSTKRDPRIDQNEPTLAISSTDAHIPWTAEEQAALEAAIKAVPTDDAQRWDSIASLVPSRSKKECMLRAKELATLLKKKAITS